MKYLYVETDAAYNLHIEIGENETRPNAAIVMDWMRQVRDQGMYWHEEDNIGVPWHSILGVQIKNK
jgi:hypothetical protein